MMTSVNEFLLAIILCWIVHDAIDAVNANPTSDEWKAKVLVQRALITASRKVNRNFIKRKQNLYKTYVKSPVFLVNSTSRREDLYMPDVSSRYQTMLQHSYAVESHGEESHALTRRSHQEQVNASNVATIGLEAEGDGEKAIRNAIQLKHDAVSVEQGQGPEIGGSSNFPLKESLTNISPESQDDKEHSVTHQISTGFPTESVPTELVDSNYPADHLRPLPPAFGTNPYEILTSSSLKKTSFSKTDASITFDNVPPPHNLTMNKKQPSSALKFLLSIKDPNRVEKEKKRNIKKPKQRRNRHRRKHLKNKRKKGNKTKVNKKKKERHK